METLFMSCLVGGILYALVSIIFGDLIGQALDGALDFLSLDGHSWLSPTALVGGITTFGGAGILLGRYTAFSSTAIVVIALFIALTAAVAVFFLYIKPMEQSENSIAFSLNDLSGKLGEVLVPISAKGYGEVMVKVGAGFTNQIAASFEGVEITSGSKVVVVEVRDSTLYVSEVNLS